MQVLLKARRGLVERGAREAIVSVCSCLEHPERYVRGAAVEALPKVCQRGDREAISTIIALLQNTQDGTREAAVEALGVVAVRGDAETVNKLLALIKAATNPARASAILALQKVADRGQPGVVEVLVGMAGSEDAGVKAAVQQALPHAASKGDRTALAAFNQDTRHEAPAVRLGAVLGLSALSHRGDRSTTAALVQAAQDSDSAVRKAAVWALAAVAPRGDRNVIRQIALSLEDPIAEVRVAGVSAILPLANAGPAGKTELKEVLLQLERCLRDPDNSVRSEAEYVAAMLAFDTNKDDTQHLQHPASVSSNASSHRRAQSSQIESQAPTTSQPSSHASSAPSPSPSSARHSNHHANSSDAMPASISVRALRSSTGLGRSDSQHPGLQEGKHATPASASAFASGSGSGSGSGRFFGDGGSAGAAMDLREERGAAAKSGRDVVPELRDGGDSESGSETAGAGAGAAAGSRGGGRVTASPHQRSPLLAMAPSPTLLSEPGLRLKDKQVEEEVGLFVVQLVTYLSYSIAVADNEEYLLQMEEAQKASWDADSIKKQKRKQFSRLRRSSSVPSLNGAATGVSALRGSGRSGALGLRMRTAAHAGAPGAERPSNPPAPTPAATAVGGEGSGGDEPEDSAGTSAGEDRGKLAPTPDGAAEEEGAAGDGSPLSVRPSRLSTVSHGPNRNPVWRQPPRPTQLSVSLRSESMMQLLRRSPTTKPDAQVGIKGVQAMGDRSPAAAARPRVFTDGQAAAGGSAGSLRVGSAGGAGRRVPISQISGEAAAAEAGASTFNFALPCTFADQRVDKRRLSELTLLQADTIKLEKKDAKMRGQNGITGLGTQVNRANVGNRQHTMTVERFFSSFTGNSAELKRSRSTTGPGSLLRSSTGL